MSYDSIIETVMPSINQLTTETDVFSWSLINELAGYILWLRWKIDWLSSLDGRKDQL